MKYNREEIREQFKDLFEKSLDLVYVNDLKGNILDANDIALNTLGYTRHEIQNLSFINLIDEEQLKKAFKYTKEIIETGKQSERSEYKLKTKDGKYIFVETYGFPLKKNGKLYAILGIGNNITERKLSDQKLKESEVKYRLISENAYDLISILNKKFKYEYINEQAFRQILGYLKKDLIGKSALKFCHPEDLENTIRALFEGFKEGKGGIELRFKHKDGHWVYFEAKGSTFIDMDGKLKALVISRDITERKNAELLVEQEIKKLKELDQIRKNLIIRVSHELKTPLIPVCVGSELLLEKYKDQLERGVNEIIKIIGRGGQRLKILINKLLDLSRLEYDMLSLDKQRTDLCKIIKEISNDMMHLVKKRDLTLNLKIPDNLDLDIDAIRIEQVITNLLSNAIKNTPPKGTIILNLQKEDNWAKLIVTDTGVGLTEKEMNIIFNRFGKIERHEKGLEYIDITGSGLGLFISKEIIDLHGGKIWGESLGRNKGCTFYVKLPIK